jgi:hypothetical protein
LPARVSGPWTREKLTYVEKYAAAFMKAMAPKRRAGKWSELVYLDLLAGPGRGIDRLQPAVAAGGRPGERDAVADLVGFIGDLNRSTRVI